MHLLALGAERLPARREDVNLGGIPEYVFGQGCDGFDDVFAAVEHEEHSLLAQKREDDRQWLLRNCHQTQLGCEHAREQPRIFEGREIEEMNRPLKL